jgi:hypothetical protein
MGGGSGLCGWVERPSEWVAYRDFLVDSILAIKHNVLRA